jgi:serine/threonine-protein kinase
LVTPPRLCPGDRLGPYEVVGALGAGGMGEVYRARDTRLGRDVALKVLPQSLAADSGRLARFRREAQTLAALNQPNIAAIYGLEDTPGTPCLVLELVEGETLAARIARAPLPPEEAMRCAVQIAAAIEAAHERGIVHRDLKPGNVMLARGDLVKVVDFGLAKSDPIPAPASGPDMATATVEAGGSMAGLLVGTLAYMSPEQARGQPVDRRTDIWSFGCVLYECLSGRPPFAGQTASDVIAGILEREPDWAALPARTPPRLRELLRRCLRKDAEVRLRDMRDVRLELTEIASRGEHAGSASEHAIAVLPFENLSGPEDEYFSDGVTDEILNALSQVDGLRVAARSSCFAFKGRRQDLRVVAEALDVTSILEGSVRRAGPKLRITVQLVNAADGYQLWSERYDREMIDVFEVQEDIARAIAARLRGTLRDASDRGRARSGTRNVEAYEAFLRGRALQSKRGRFLPEAIACLERAIALDPGYAEAIAWLSDSYRLMGTFGIAPFSVVMPKAKSLAEKALAIDPTLPEAWATVACIEEQYDWTFDRATATWNRALELDPRHARARAQRALWAQSRGAMSMETAVAEMRRAVQDDPLGSWVGAMHSHVLGFAGRHEESILEAQRAFDLEPDSFFAQWNLMRAHSWAGRYDRALELAAPTLQDSGRQQWALGILAWTYGKAGRPDRARAVYDEMEGRSRHEFIAPFWLVTAAAAAGLTDRALEHVVQAVAARDPLVVWGHSVPFWDGVRTHARFKEAIRPVGVLR